MTWRIVIDPGVTDGAQQSCANLESQREFVSCKMASVQAYCSRSSTRFVWPSCTIQSCSLSTTGVAKRASLANLVVAILLHPGGRWTSTESLPTLLMATCYGHSPGHGVLPAALMTSVLRAVGMRCPFLQRVCILAAVGHRC